MAELFRQAPLGRFTVRAEDYDRHRPTYPVEAIDLVIARAGLGASSLLVDAGCGTGISSRLFAMRGLPVIGIEPNDAMRRRAEETLIPAGYAAPAYRAGRAEETGLADGVADVVLAAQAFHWFEAEAALAEFHRVLAPGGWVALLWNERDETDACTAAYGDVIRTASNAAEMEGGRQSAGAALEHSSRFRDCQLSVFTHRQALDREGLLGRALSISYAPRDLVGVEHWRRTLGEVFERYQQQGEVTLLYCTTLYLARRRD